MARTYAQLTQEIEALKTQAEAVLQEEKAGVAARIREAIAIYGLTAEQLGFGRASLPSKARAASSGSQVVKSATGGSVKYRDDAGNAWGGRGPKPKWLKAGLASGRTLESFLASPGRARSVSAPPAERSAAKPKLAPGPEKAKQKFKTTIKYRDGAGNQWSGRGPKPGWVKTALEGGKTLEQLLA